MYQMIYIKVMLVVVANYDNFNPLQLCFAVDLRIFKAQSQNGQFVLTLNNFCNFPIHCDSREVDLT